MTDTPKPIKWHTIENAAAEARTTATNSPGVIYPMGTNALPEQLKQITGVASYYLSGYVTPHVLTNGLTVGGEMLVARIDGATTKNDNFVFATSPGSIVQFAGPFTGFGHHVSSGQSIQVNSLFGHTPFSRTNEQPGRSVTP
jgi:hypothetical protein